ncbi:hypothetical protein [Acetobacter estunensis]|uniref:hypothetical protein n=1 Tax=Acetobacter estunensis TaxID=104097 RepID=UPI001C2CF54E|nr:hypothetical protein [Acetobacter estunensis]MBV1837379.1 hypothetical protein [Acetobacter estunensis]
MPPVSLVPRPPRPPATAAAVISPDQLEVAARAYYAYCEGDWDTLDPKAKALYRTRMQLALTAFVDHAWRPIATAPLNGTAVFLFLRIKGRGDYLWLDRWDPQLRSWVEAPHAKPTHWTPLMPPPLV